MTRVIDFPHEWATSTPIDNMSFRHEADDLRIFGVLLKDGSNLWALIYPGGAACGSATMCGSCGRSIEDTAIDRCYDCPTAATDACWVQSWVGNAMAEEVLHGTVEAEFPVVCIFDGDSLEAHVDGPVSPLAERSAEVPPAR